MLAFSITACGSKETKNATADKNSTKTESAENKKENDNSTETSTEDGPMSIPWTQKVERISPQLH